MPIVAEPSIVQDAINYLMGTLNRTKAVAVGIVSVMYAVESKLHTGSQGHQSTETPGTLNPGGAYGIASWNGPRQAALGAFASKYGLKVDDLFTQLHFVLTESANSYPQVWAVMQNPATTYQEMIVAFTDYYENPANKQNEISVAEAFAASIWDQVVVPTPTTPLPSPAAAVAEATPPHIDIPAPVAGLVAVAEQIAGAAIPGVAALAPVIAAVAPAALAVALPGSLVIDPALITAVTPLIEALLGAMVKAAISGAVQLKAA